jgi:hypothetical protein
LLAFVIGVDQGTLTLFPSFCHDPHNLEGPFYLHRLAFYSTITWSLYSSCLRRAEHRAAGVGVPERRPIAMSWIRLELHHCRVQLALQLGNLSEGHGACAVSIQAGTGELVTAMLMKIC